MYNPLVPSPVRRLPSMFPLMPENVLWLQPRVQIPPDPDLDLPEAIARQLPQSSLAAIPQLPPLVQFKLACLHEDSLCADLVPVIPLLRPCPLSPVSKRSTCVLFYALTHFPDHFCRNISRDDRIL